MKVRSRGLVVLWMACSIVLLTAYVAAACPTNVPSSSWTQSINQHTGSITWSKPNKSAALSMVTGTLSINRCADIWFDWSTQSGHFDARFVRVCRSSGARSGGFSPESPGSRVLLGMAKLMVCRWDSSSPNTFVNCIHHPQETCTFNPPTPNPDGAMRPYYAWWKLNANGTNSMYLGGDPTSPTA